MAKKCDCHGVVEMLERDPRLRALPLAPRMLWFALVRAMQSLSVSVLRFGSQVPEAREVAMMVGIAESELEANLPTILARGLLEREADGALASPLLRGLMARSETNRANGLRGGATRRAQAEARRRQMELSLPVAGGRAEATADAESDAEAKPGAADDPAKLKLESSLSTKPKLAVANEDFHRIGQAALEAAGFDPARSMANYGIVRQWLADGASETLILETIRAKTRPGIKHLGYFVDAIRDALARGGPAGGTEPTARSMAWEYALDQWRVNNKQGRMPMPQDFGADGLPVAAAA